MTYKRIIVLDHAGSRMHERAISYNDILQVLSSDEIIEQYPDDTPYPSRLILGFSATRAIHVVATDNHKDQATLIITVYEPDPALWHSDFRRRK
jgi:hypothetical protein